MKQFFLCLTITTGLVIAGCSGSDESAVADFPRGVTADSIKIGTHTDLSSVLAIWGVPMVNGMRQRFDELNASGGVHGRSIDYVVEDTQYQVPLAVKATNKLINVDEVFAILGAMGTPHNNAVFDTMFEANVPSLFPLTAAVSMYEPLHPMKFSYYVSYRDQIRGGMNYLVAENDYKKVCVQHLATDYGAETGIGFTQFVEEHGLEVVYAGRHKGTETDFTGTVTSIKNSGCELLVLGPFIKDAIQIYTSARDSGWGGAVMANMVPYLPEVPGAADGRMEGFYASSGTHMPDFAGNLDDEWQTQWHEAYVARFNEEPALQSIMGYVMADLLILALESAGPDVTVEKMLAGLEGIARYDDPFGGPTMSFSAEKHVAGDSLNLYQVRDRKWVTVAESLPY